MRDVLSGVYLCEYCDPLMTTAVVTGAGSGVGRAIALKFAAEGWNVALVSRRADTLSQTIAVAHPDSHDRLAAFPCDVSNPAAVEAMGEAVLARFDTVDVLVNAAGINVPRRSFEVVSLDDWHAVLATNLHGAYYCVRAFLPGMRERRTGTIVNINSDVGKIARDLAGPAYVSSKFGLSGLTQQINAEERRNGVRACSICPRDINTPLLDKRPQPPSQEVRAGMIQPEDMAALVWLVTTLPSRAIVEEISLSSR
jgi:NAD(P)-dependent dehydrogenase (short-subunit alcohol dehydrogenase family)